MRPTSLFVLIPALAAVGAAQSNVAVTARTIMGTFAQTDNNAPRYATLPANSKAATTSPLAVAANVIESGSPIAHARTKLSYRTIDGLPAVRIFQNGFVAANAVPRIRSVGTANGQTTASQGQPQSWLIQYTGTPGERVRVHVRLRAWIFGKDTTSSTPTDIRGVNRVDVGDDNSFEFSQPLDNGRHLGNHPVTIDATGRLVVRVESGALITSRANWPASYSSVFDVSFEPIRGILASVHPYGPVCGPDVYGVTWVSGKDRHLRTILEGATPNAAAILVIGVGQTNVPLPGFLCDLLTFPVAFLGDRTDILGRAITDFPTVPADLGIDVCFQYGVVQPGSVAMSKALRLRVYPDSDKAYDHFDINHVLSTGQSLALGGLGSPVLSTSQPFKNLMFQGGLAAVSNSLVPLVEATWESMSSGLSTLASQLHTKPFNNAGAGSPAKSHDVLVSLHARPGFAYALLKKGTQAFDDGISQFRIAELIAAAQNKSYVVRCVTAVHGENDHQIYNTEYAKNLAEWQADYESEIQGRGQTEPVPMLYSQMSSFTNYRSPTSVIPGQQLAASVANPRKLVLVGAKYIFDYVDGVHMTSKSYRHMGEYYGKVYNQVILEGGTWEPLRPLQATRNGAVIHVRFHVPEPPLVLDTTLVSDPGNYGFEFGDNSGKPPAIQSVRLLDEDTVEIVLAKLPAGSQNTLSYAHTGRIGASAGPTTGARGCLRDSDQTPSVNNQPLFNWAVHFSMPVN